MTYLATLKSRALLGMTALSVNVEVHLANGLPGITIVGLPEAEVRESRDRVRAALQTSGFDFPARRITINLAPADLPKGSGSFDLPIALGILAASRQLPLAVLEGYECAGELALDGTLRPIKGALSMAFGAQQSGHRLILPSANATEASWVSGLTLFSAQTLRDVHAHFTQEAPLLAVAHQPYCAQRALRHLPDLAEIRGQLLARRALEVAAAGGHSLLMSGPPGSGKSMLAHRLPAILPPLTEAEALEVAVMYSLSHQGFKPEQFGQRPFRAPHHTASGVALVGGGSQVRPGEISLAHQGVLFLDELPEFERKVLEVLREPLETGSISIARAARQAEFPAAFQLIAAMNPCPCGYLGSAEKSCKCSPNQVAQYKARLSGPFLDRIDLHIDVPSVPHDVLLSRPQGENSETVRARVEAASLRQKNRQGCLNARLSLVDIDQHCTLDTQATALLAQAMQRLQLSARASHRILKVARTLADLANSPMLQASHLAEAIQLRRGLIH